MFTIQVSHLSCLTITCLDKVSKFVPGSLVLTTVSTKHSIISYCGEEQLRSLKTSQLEECTPCLTSPKANVYLYGFCFIQITKEDI